MSNPPEVSVIIPTWNRRDRLLRAVDSVLAQSHPVEEIIVVDDGSTDGSGEALAQRYGDRVTCLRQANAGVSAARNRGLEVARGRFLALLDSDDEWLPEKTAKQLALFRAKPELGMVLCDVRRVDSNGALISIFERRTQIPEDGPALRHVLRDPSLAPVSALLRREVYEAIGGFDESLRTAEDLDFHLRVAAKFPIGVVSETLARALRGHDGLSSLASTYDDYVTVMERAASAAAGQVPEDERRAALAAAYLKNAQGMVWHRRWGPAWTLARKAWSLASDWPTRRSLLGLVPAAGKRFVRGLMPSR